MSGGFRSQAAPPLPFVLCAVCVRVALLFRLLANGFRPGIRSWTELNEGFSSVRLLTAGFRFFSVPAAAASSVSSTKYIRVLLTTSVRISRVQRSRFARASPISSLGNLVIKAICFWVRAPHLIASRTRSAGRSFLKMRAIRVGDSPARLATDRRGLSGDAFAPSNWRARLYSRSACRLLAIFWRMHLLQ